MNESSRKCLGVALKEMKERLSRRLAVKRDFEEQLDMETKGISALEAQIREIEQDLSEDSEARDLAAA